MTRPRCPTFDPTSSTIAPPLRRTIRRKLLHWYDRHKRDLPWRHRARDPYAQWVAEVMLQQTRVDTVIEYYRRFLKRFPGLRVLAEADHEEVLKHWEGLGYYRRILHLHRAARLLRDRGDGVPQTASELRRLPGVGDYTAAAISSIAFQAPEAAVDANVARVLARLFGVAEDIRTSAARTRITDVARQLLPRKRCGDFNQAWMDLGSMVCTPKTPTCKRCPLASACAAGATGRADELPVRGKGAATVRSVSLVVAVFTHRGKVLLQRRPTGGLWSGLWEFPNVEVRGRASHLRLVQRLAEDNGLQLSARPHKVSPVRHRLTHRALTFLPYVAVPTDRPVARRPSRRWVTPGGFERLSVSTAHRRIYAAARELLGSELIPNKTRS